MVMINEHRVRTNAHILTNDYACAAVKERIKPDERPWSDPDFLTPEKNSWSDRGFGTNVQTQYFQELGTNSGWKKERGNNTIRQP